MASCLLCHSRNVLFLLLNCWESPRPSSTQQTEIWCRSQAHACVSPTRSLLTSERARLKTKTISNEGANSLKIPVQVERCQSGTTTGRNEIRVKEVFRQLTNAIGQLVISLLTGRIVTRTCWISHQFSLKEVGQPRCSQISQAGSGGGTDEADDCDPPEFSKSHRLLQPARHQLDGSLMSGRQCFTITAEGHSGSISRHSKSHPSSMRNMLAESKPRISLGRPKWWPHTALAF